MVEIDMLPAVDLVFEEFLCRNLVSQEKDFADEARLDARLWFYGSHYSRLFSKEPLVGSHTGQHCVLHQVLSDEAMDLGEKLYDQFLHSNPDRVKPFRPV